MDANNAKYQGRVTMSRSLRSLEASLTGIFASLQLFAAFFLSILGLAMTFGRPDFLGAFLAALGLTFLTLLAINIKTRA